MELSAEQLALVCKPVDHRALLIIAGPGSGKTRVLCERISWLLDQGVEADQIVALTFTQQAAFELNARTQLAERSGVWAGTFHAFANRLLHKHGGNWGLPRPFKVIDEPTQTYLLRETVERLLRWRCEANDARDVLKQISRRKRQGISQDDFGYIRQRSFRDVEEIRAIDLAYCRMLRERAMLDYDDLVAECNIGLAGDADAAEETRSQARWLLIDEFQDVSSEQYAFIRHLSPPQDHRSRLLAVGDPRQSIYGFRGADTDAISKRFLRDYDPEVRPLSENFRSVPSIIDCANAIQPPRNRPQSLFTKRKSEQAVTIIRVSDETAEASSIADLVQRRIAARDSPGSIGILYAIHRRADAIERELLTRNIGVHRVRQSGSFGRSLFDSALALLDAGTMPPLADGRSMLALGGAPTGLLDEIDWLDLGGAWPDEHEQRRIAQSPGDLRRFRAVQSLLDETSASTAAISKPEATQRLLALQRRLIDPVSVVERENVDETIQYLARKVAAPSRQLEHAITARRPVRLVVGPSADARLAGMILQAALAVLPPDDPAQPPFTIALGEERAGDGIALSPIVDPTATFTVATIAWVIGWMLISRRVARRRRYVLFDVEATGLDVGTARIIELAAVRLDERGEQIGEPFERLVQSRSLQGTIAKLTGLTAAELFAAPPINQVLADFRAWLEPDDVLLGHNIGEYDLALLNRHAVEQNIEPFGHPSLDTLPLAKALFPETGHSLGDLALAFGCEERRAHRALPDVLTNVDVFRRLLAERNHRQSIRAFADTLPLVAMSILHSDAGQGLDNQTLVDAGLRSWRNWPDNPLLAQARKVAGQRWSALIRARETLKCSREDEEWDLFRQEWEGLVNQHLAIRPDLSLEELAGYMALASGSHDVCRSDCVAMMTVHAAKGKEWDTVIIASVESDLFPAGGSKKLSKDEIAEGERLLYVGVTRAKDRLAIFHCRKRDGRQHAPHPLLQRFPADDAIVWRFPKLETQPIAAD